MAVLHHTAVFHNSLDPSIDPAHPELSTEGKVVFITGGGSGLGPRLIHSLAKSGATNIVIIGRTEATLESAKKTVEAQYSGVSVLALTTDISDQKEVNAAFTSTKNGFGPVDILVSNVETYQISCLSPQLLSTSSLKGFDVNFKGDLILAQAFLANVVDGPILINVDTISAHAWASHPAMEVSKVAAVKMWEYIAAGNPHGRTVTVHLGVIDTAMNKECNDAGMIFPLDSEFPLYLI